jgi:hypothetical protein
VKTLFFLIVLALVAYAVIWKMRKSDAEAKLEQSKCMKLRNEQRKEAITPQEHVKWPVIIRSVTGDGSSEDEIPEPSMATIEFEPTEHPTLQH